MKLRELKGIIISHIPFLVVSTLLLPGFASTCNGGTHGISPSDGRPHFSEPKEIKLGTAAPVIITTHLSAEWDHGGSAKRAALKILAKATHYPIIYLQHALDDSYYCRAISPRHYSKSREGSSLLKYQQERSFF